MAEAKAGDEFITQVRRAHRDLSSNRRGRPDARKRASTSASKTAIAAVVACLVQVLSP